MCKIISKTQLERKDVILWAQFITTMVLRTPDSIARIKSEGKRAILTEMNAAQAEYSSLKDNTDPDTPIEWLQINRPGLIEDFGLMQIPRIGLNKHAMQNVLSFSWHTVEFHNSSKPILSSDRPCIVVNGLDKKNCIIALPLSPRHAFFAFRPNSNVEQKLKAQAVSRLAVRLNESVVGQAAERAYCQHCSDAPDKFFLRCLSESS